MVLVTAAAATEGNKHGLTAKVVLGAGVVTLATVHRAQLPDPTSLLSRTLRHNFDR